MKVTLPSLTHTHTHAVAPTLLPGNESLAFILISENDDARGVIQFTSSEINTTEPSQSFVLLTRTAGTFGEVRTCDSYSGSFNISVQILLSLHVLQVHSILPLCSIPFCHSVPFHFATQFHSILPVGSIPFCSSFHSSSAPILSQVSVQWEAAPTTASTLDYAPPGGTITFLPGVTNTTLPLTITDDSLPEFLESLTLRLIPASVSGGARVGVVQSTVVNILANDDPNGALGEHGLNSLSSQLVCLLASRHLVVCIVSEPCFFTSPLPSLPLCAEFAPDSRTREVAEPDGSTPLTVTLTVRRLGGTVGVIQAVWNVTSSDGMQLL